MEEPLSFLKMTLEQVDIHKDKKRTNQTKVLETDLMILNLDHRN